MATVPVAFVESLLWEDESNTLDFKAQQYPFSGATDEQKAEIIKDILAFANAFRRDEAYILLGVRDVPGGRGIVTGVANHLDDADLQQLVNSKTNRIVELHYHALTVDNLQVGVIRIPCQKRPAYLLKSYGKLAAHTVYIRHGSSTAVATPEEIARMGVDDVQTAAPTVPTLDLQFGDRASHVRAGTSVTLASVVLHVPKKIPDYEDPRAKEPFGFPANMSNRSYNREVAEHTQFIQLVQPVGLVIENTSGTTANDVRLEMSIPDPDDRLAIFDEDDVPSEPEMESYMNRLIPTMVQRDERVLTVRKTGAAWLVRAHVGKIQPRAIHYVRDKLYIGAFQDVTLPLDVHLYADNLPEPQHAPLTVTITSSERTVTLEELLRLHGQWYMNTPKAKALMRQMEERRRS